MTRLAAKRKPKAAYKEDSPTFAIEGWLSKNCPGLLDSRAKAVTTTNGSAEIPKR